MIRLLIMDVDGTLTDGKIYMSSEGELFKSFDIKDGCGIKDILPSLNISAVIITARQSKILENRCRELNISYLYQGERDKYRKLLEVLHEISSQENKDITLENCAYIGDDIIDIQCMNFIKEAGGVVACPFDAVEEVKEISDYISSKTGGNGAVRDFIEWLRKNRGELC